MIYNLVVGNLGTNCWIAHYENNDAYIIDPGDDADEINKFLEDKKLKPAAILLTHGHFDHIAGLNDLYSYWKNKSSNPDIVISKADSIYLGEGAYEHHCKSIKACFGRIGFLDEALKNIPEATVIVEEGSHVGPFEVLMLSGHTEGSVGFYNKQTKELFSGDTLFNCGVGRTDLPEGDANKLSLSLKRLFALDPEITVFPGHGGITTIGNEMP
ncbi:MAG: MBL fold metallo-hydrolase [Termitinemataceae bacterium]|nr:MAG: MBL fold metallo-hydrolase [Termitinemataceae bacterium]